MLRNKKIQSWICVLSAVFFSVTILCTVFASEIHIQTDSGSYSYMINSLEDMLENHSFEDSDIFGKIVLTLMDEQNDYLQAQKLFGSAVDTTTIDIGYYNMVINDGDSTGVRYYLNDLIKWGESYEFDTIEISSGRYKQISKIKKEEPYTIIDSSDYGPGSYFYLINNEYFLTKDGRSLYTYTDVAATMEKYTVYLRDTINYIHSLYAAYQNGSGENVPSNMTMKLVDASDSAAVSRAEEKTVLAPKYLIYHRENQSTLTNITGMEDWRLQYYLNLQSGQNLYITVDTSYPVNDLFTTVEGIYNSMQRAFMVLLPLDLLLAVLFLFSVIRRTVLEGRNVLGTEARPRKIAEWKTAFCIAAPLLIASMVLLAVQGVVEEMWWYDLSNMTSFVIVSVTIVTATCILTPVFLYFFEELVLRLKKKTFFRKSFLKVIVDMVKKLLSFIKASIKWCLFYLLFLLVNLMVVFSGYAEMIVIAVIADLVVGAYFFRHFTEFAKLQKQMKRISTREGIPDIQPDHYHGMNRRTAELLGDMNLGITRAVDISLKDERMKTELITNVSHDIKTPLTSIINYVDLLKKEDIASENAQKYISILDQKSMRLKQLIDDLMEASKITSGNIEVQKVTLEAGELLRQTAAEYSDKLSAKGLELVMSLPEEPVYFQADSRHIWRVLSNLFGNAAKYAMPGTRVYLNVYGSKAVSGGTQLQDANVTSQQMISSVHIEMKNISESPLNITPEELTERFVRGDQSRTMEGNGLGLSIAKSLMEVMGGRMEIVIDGDLFKVVLVF